MVNASAGLHTRSKKGTHFSNIYQDGSYYAWTFTWDNFGQFWTSCYWVISWTAGTSSKKFHKKLHRYSLGHSTLMSFVHVWPNNGFFRISRAIW